MGRSKKNKRLKLSAHRISLKIRSKFLAAARATKRRSLVESDTEISVRANCNEQSGEFYNNKQPNNFDSNNAIHHGASASSTISDSTIQQSPTASIDFAKPSCSSNYEHNETMEWDANIHEQSDVQNDDKEVLPQNLFPMGRRIVDIGHFFKQLFSIGQHQPFNCTLSDMYFSTVEKQSGLASVFTLKCKMCGLQKSISTDTDENVMDVNTAVVLSTISTGNGHSQLVESHSVLNIPSISFSRYAACHNKLTPVIHQTAWKVMEEAGKEEFKLACDIGSVDANENPLITVIADGAWCKRSYKTNYNASSGVACIIGQKTGKLLFLGIRNKYCTICARSESKGLEVSPHTCFKNWSGTSTSMEADIIVEGFKNSLALHGLIFSKLVGDGDSSVSRKLLQSRPYGTRLVEKVECRNHLLRNYCGKLRELSQKRFSSSNKLVPPTLRKLLESNILRLRTAVTKAVHFRKSEDKTLEEKVASLSKDLLNSSSHVFGEHGKCEEIGYFCKQVRRQEDVNRVPELQACGLYDDITCATYRLVHNAGSLIMEMDNNSAESYNSVVCKFIGGKRINFAQKGSFQTRCEAAAVCFNTKGQHYSVIHKALTAKSPGQYTKKYLERISKRRKYNCKRKLLVKKARIQKNVLHADKDYGPNATDHPDLPEELLTKKANEFLKQLEKDEQGRVDLEKQTRGQSENPIWIRERTYRVTASIFGKICKLRRTTPVANTVKSILYKEFYGNCATRYGRDNEPRARREFESKTKLMVEECGLFVDELYPYIGASPDGLIANDSIIEIKCPAAAAKLSIKEGIATKKIRYLDIDEGGSIQLKLNHDYMYQIQGQLHITQRQYCYFVVWTTVDMKIQQIERDDSFWQEKIINNLKNFYLKCLLPEIIDPRIPRMMEIRKTENWRQE